METVRPAGLPPAHVGGERWTHQWTKRATTSAGRSTSRHASRRKRGRTKVFVGEDALPHVTPSGFQLVEVGAFELKGIAKPLILYEAKRDDS